MCVFDQEEFRARPRLDIIQPLPEGFEEISSDALTVRNFQENECRDYRLGESVRNLPPANTTPRDSLHFHILATLTYYAG